MAGGNDTTDTHSANGGENTFKLSKKIEEGMLNTMTVTVAGTVKTAGTHYNVDTVGQKIVFTQGNFPPSGTNNVVITYSYDVLIAEEDYTVDSAGKNVTFTTAPVTGVNNVAIEYDYEIPMVIQGEKRSSIETYGKHSKTLTLSWANYDFALVTTGTETGSNIDVRFNMNINDSGGAAEATIGEIGKISMLMDGKG